MTFDIWHLKYAYGKKNVSEECCANIAEYKGETGRNALTRGKEHLENLEAEN